jgi:hypothetical protein
MWLTILAYALGGFVAAEIGTEILRSIVHRRREQRSGIGGSQDVAMWSLIPKALLLLVGIVALFMHVRSLSG